MKKKHYFFQFFALLMCMMVGANSAWGEDKWVKTDPAKLATGDVVVIVDVGSDRAMTNDKGTSSAPAAEVAYYVADSNRDELLGDKNNVVPEKWKWTVTVNNGSYKFGVGESYLYCTNTNNGVRVGSNTNNSFTIYKNNRVNYLYNTDTKRYLGVYNNQDWRCYSSINTNINSCVTVFYKKTSSVPVDDPTDERTAINMTSFTAATTTLTKGETTTTSVETDAVTFLPDITYASSNEDVASVGTDGVITAVGKGTATITATLNIADDDENYKAGTTQSMSLDITVKGINHTALFYANGEVFYSVEVEEGEAISFPVEEPADVEEKVFVGWTSNRIDGVTQEAPYFVTAATIGDADRSFYAVYASQTEGEGQETLSQTLSYDTWTYSGETTDKKSYRLFGDGAYVESAAFDLSSLTKVKIFGGTYGGASTYKTVTIGDGVNIWKDVEMTGTNNAKEHPFTDGTALSGNKPLRVISTCGDGSNSGIRISKIEIYTIVPSIAYTDYCTTVAEDTRIDPGLSFANSEETVEWVAKDNYTLQSLSTTATAVPQPIAWSSSNEEVATIDENNGISIIGLGTTTITATFAGDNSYKRGVASYTLTVQDSRPALTLSFTPETLALNVGATAELPTLNGNTGNGEVTYASSDESIAAISGDGVTVAFQVVAGQTEGTATITATVAGTSSYQGGTASFTVTVTDPNRKGSLANPFTVAEALENTPSEGVYVKGIVSRFTNTGVYTDSYHRYFVSDNGTVQSDELQIFNGKGLNNEAFTSDDDVQLGDVVVIYGNLILYKTTKEMDAGNYIVSLKRKVDAGLAYETTAFVTFPGDDDFVAPTLTNPNQLTVTYASSNDDVAYVDEQTGEVLLGDEEGKATITATFAGNDDYKAGTASYTITLKKLEAGLAYEDTEFEVRVNDEFTAPTLTNPNQLAVTYASSDEDVALVDEQTGEVVIGAAGVATITATFAGSTKFNAGTASYTITVVSGKLTAEIALVAESVSMNAGTTKELSTLYTTNSDGEVSYESSNSDYVGISDGRLVAIQPTTGAETVTVTITVAESESYQAVSTTLPVAVTQLADVAAFSPAGGFVKVTATKDIVNGEYLIVNEDARVAFNGALETLDAVGNIINVEIEDEIIEETEATKSATFTIDTEKGFVKAKSGKFIGVSSYSNGLKAFDTGVGHGFEIDDNHNAVLTVSTSGGSMTLRYNEAADQNRFRYYKSGQEPIQLYRLQNPELTIGSAQWRTLVSSACLQFPDEVSAYIVTAVGENVTLRRVRRVKAGVPVVLNAEASSYMVTVITEDQCEDTSANLLQVSTQREGENVYVLASKTQGVGFYRWTGGWLGKGRVYLPGVSVTNARSFLGFNLNETTAISSMQGEPKSAQGVFNLNGQRVDQPRKGSLYIVNGKKMVVR